MEKPNEDETKRVNIELKAGTHMPRHIATSDAYLFVEAGSALLIYGNEKLEVSNGTKTLIPANEEHLLKIITDLKGYIILEKDARIDYANQDLNLQ